MAEAAVAAALRSGALRPVLGDILPLEKAAQAHEDIIARGRQAGPRCSCALSKATPEKQGLLAVIPP